jgi:riboflavin kinase/FMN adenylyltransferase
MASHRIDWQETPPAECRGGVIAIGNFDGVHRGHASLVAEVGRQARSRRVPAVVLTFDPHPREILRPGLAQPLLTTTADRTRLLTELGAGQVVILHTTPDLLALSAADFFQQVIRQRLQTAALVEGVNFGFGHNREGNIETLGRLCREAGLPLTVVPQMVLDGREVSSSQVRQCLLRGEVAEAARLLGRPYQLRGLVGTGQRRGQTLGFPTANLEQAETLVPGDGVYAVRAVVASVAWPGAANVGSNPTFAEQARKVEVHLIGFRGDLYGQPLAVDFVQRLRDTRPFGSAAELVEQLRRDVEQARQFAGLASVP